MTLPCRYTPNNDDDDDDGNDDDNNINELCSSHSREERDVAPW